MSLSGNPTDFVLVFLAGFFLSLTPCVYPLIPITIGYIGIKAGGSRSKGFILSLMYVTGLALTYSTLGLIASLGGSLFGSISVKPITRILVGLLILGFGLSMLDLFPVLMPSWFKFPFSRKQGYLSALTLGLGSGLVVSPCISPVLGSILVYLATRKNIFYGTFLLLSFAYGMGFIFIIIGTFSGILLNLPKLGKWMLYIKRSFAFIMIAVGLYFIFNALTKP